MATKLVQRSDEDPTIFEVTYRGRHTCSQNTHFVKASASSTKEGAKYKQSRHHDRQEPEVKESQELIISFGTSELEGKTEDLDNKEEIFPSFSFPQTSITEDDNMEHNIFTESTMEMEINFMRSFSPSFLLPTDSESKYFSVSPCHMNNSVGLEQTVHTPESGVSTPNSPIGDFDFSLVKVDLDPNFPLDNLDYFS